jgi:dihydrofolate synthase / folylpolyglutamate synthase
MNFREALDYLLSLGHETVAIKLGLRNTELLLEALNNPQLHYSSVQIAGTNGKGSTAVVLDSICRKAGITTGLYTSPHLESITERIKINGTSISEEEFARLATIIRNAAETLLADGKIDALPTFFEQVTAIALLAFQEAGIEVAILETGLGGRLDSTTAAKAKIVAITQIAIDHEEYLGNTLASIAAEKAAIIQPGVEAVIVANHQAKEALAVIENRCRENNLTAATNQCEVTVEEVAAHGTFCATFQTSVAKYERVWIGLAGEHQLDNVAVAIQLAESLRVKGSAISHRAICDGIEQARHPGRLEYISSSREFLLDGAHNPAAARTLANYLRRFAPRPLTIIFGAMREKRAEDMISILADMSDIVILTKPDNIRAADPQEVLSRSKAGQAGKIMVAPTSGDAIAAAVNSTPPHGLILVTGSLYLVGEIRSKLICGSHET